MPNGRHRMGYGRRARLVLVNRRIRLGRVLVPACSRNPSNRDCRLSLRARVPRTGTEIKFCSDFYPNAGPCLGKASRPGNMAWPGQVGEGRVFHHESGPSQPGRRHGRAGMRGQHGGPGAVGSNGMPPPFPHQRGLMLPPAPPASVVAARMRTVQAQVDQLVAVLEPCFKSEERRM